MNDIVRICPLCSKHNPTDATFCTCGTLLADVDFTHLGSTPQPEMSDDILPLQPAENLIVCPYADCSQPNPSSGQRCIYCNRELNPTESESVPEEQFCLPASLRVRFNVVEALPTEGAQADLVLVRQKSEPYEKLMLKLYRKGIKPDWQVLERLQIINNPHLVRMFEHGMTEDATFELMEFCADGTLRDLADSGPLPHETLLILIKQLSTTLRLLHEQKILHRDLKPENILLRSRLPLEIALSDFGASSLKMATQYFTGGARTVSYAAPEVLTGILDEKSDWWSLGMLLLEVITGRHPYADLSEQVVLYQLATESVDVKGVFDESLRMLCRGLLLRNPKKRWGATEVARWLAGDQSLTTPEDSTDGTAIKAYTIGRSQCMNRTDLALALVRYWDDAKKDLMRGIILHWVEQDLRDFNLARAIHDVMLRSDLSDDARLLRVIVSALPGIPPIWRGRVITQETLARSAIQAVDSNLDALDWLLSIHKEDVLKILAESGNADMAKIAQTWTEGINEYRRYWELAKVLEEVWRRRPRTNAMEVPDIDYLMYLAPIRMSVPAIGKILTDLVLALYIPAYSESAKKSVLNASAGLADQCSWYTDLVRETDGDGELRWSVLQRLLPFAIEDAKVEKKNQQQAVRNADVDVTIVIDRINTGCKQLLRYQKIDELDSWETIQLSKNISTWIELSTWLKHLDHNNANLQDMIEKLDTVTLRVLHLQSAVDEHQHLLEVNQILLKPARLIIGVATITGVMAFSGLWAGGLLALSGVWIIRRRILVKASDAEVLQRLERMIEGFTAFHEKCLRKKSIQ